MWQNGLVREIGLNFGLAFGAVFVVAFGAYSLMQITFFAPLKKELLSYLSRTSTVAKCGIVLCLISLFFAVFCVSSAVHWARDWSGIPLQERVVILNEVMDTVEELPVIGDKVTEPLNPPLEINTDPYRYDGMFCDPVCKPIEEDVGAKPFWFSEWVWY